MSCRARGVGDEDDKDVVWGGAVDIGLRNGSGIGVACWLLDGQIGSSLYSKYSKYASWRSSECESQLGAIIANCELGVGVGLNIDTGV